jgi:hypothetical protein
MDSEDPHPRPHLCLPAFVAQFRHVETRIRYGSSGSCRIVLNESRTAEGDEAEFPRTFTSGTSRPKWQTNNGAPWNGEVELVSNSQGRSTCEVDKESQNGIMRKTEVTHIVTVLNVSKDAH